MPARQKPVAARQPHRALNDDALAAAASVQTALASAQMKNTRRAEWRSATASSANTRVPRMKPACTADVSGPTSAAAQP